MRWFHVLFDTIPNEQSHIIYTNPSTCSATPMCVRTPPLEGQLPHTPSWTPQISQTLSASWECEANAWIMTSCAEVNAAICKSSGCESPFKRSAFAFAPCKKLCRWRHLLLLSEDSPKVYTLLCPSRRPVYIYLIEKWFYFTCNISWALCDNGFSKYSS